MNEVVSFFTPAMGSKWGSEDGYKLGRLLAANGLETVDYHQVLVEVFERRILPRLDQEVVYYTMNATTHNPIRFVSVDGAEVDELGDFPAITPDHIDVPVGAIIELARRCIGKRFAYVGLDAPRSNKRPSSDYQTDSPDQLAER